MRNKLKEIAKDTNIFLQKFITKQKKTELIPAMKYGLFPGGKKIRSKILLDIGSIFKIKYQTLIAIGAAVECIHAYSLIHDDLPCMDNDTLRRGKPSTHIKFGEATAVLAGNSLLTMAFEILSSSYLKISESSKLSLIKRLSECSGHLGIAGGQYLDLSFEKKKKNIPTILDMQRKKTGKLFNFCCYAVGIIAGKKSQELKSLGQLGEDIGLLFQLADDFIDIKGSNKIAGKSTKKDQKKGKSTLVKLMGYQKAYTYADLLKKKILSKLVKRGKKAKDLIKIVDFILERNY